MSFVSIAFLIALYVGPIAGAAVAALTVGRQVKGLQAGIGGGMCIAFCFMILGMFDRTIFYAGPVVGTIVAFALVRWLSRP